MAGVLFVNQHFTVQRIFVVNFTSKMKRTRDLVAFPSLFSLSLSYLAMRALRANESIDQSNIPHERRLRLQWIRQFDIPRTDTSAHLPRWGRVGLTSA